jgi:hypothetical protein
VLILHQIRLLVVTLFGIRLLSNLRLLSDGVPMNSDSATRASQDFP